MRVGILGAGAVGRGLLGKICVEAGHGVSFFDTNDWLILQLAQRRYYPVRINRHLEWVGPIRGEHMTFIENRDLIFVCVRPDNLPYIVETLGRAFQRKIIKRVVVVENMPSAAAELWHLIDARFNDLGSDVWFGQGIAECVIPEIPFEVGDGLVVYGDPEGYLVVPEDIGIEHPAVRVAENFDMLWDLKWYCHCGLHLVVALLGLKNNLIYIHEVLRNRELYGQVAELMAVVSTLLTRKYPGPQVPRRIAYEIHNLSRGLPPDTCRRVARDLKRKLQPGERLAALEELVGESLLLQQLRAFAQGIL